jgi:hypothetical protein
VTGGCNTCGLPAGYVRVYQYVRTGKATKEFDTQAAALTEQRSNGGAGRVQRVTRKAPTGK